MMLLVYVCFVLLFGTSPVSTEYDPFMDSEAFRIDWPGSVGQVGSSSAADLVPTDADLEVLHGENRVVVLTQNKEKYSCILPSVGDDSNQESIKSYTGLSELELLQPLFKQTSCSYRIESYWTYELCHGSHLRQYHEEKEPGKKTKLQEYYLGKNPVPPDAVQETAEFTHSQEASDEEDQKASSPRKKAPLQKVEGIEIPYYEVIFEDGTPCDLTELPRRVALHYVCQPDGKGEVYELKETSTCEYEVVVLTSLLCVHPAYKIKKESVNKIQCLPLEGAPDQPLELKALEDETEHGKYNRKENIPSQDAQQLNQKASQTYYQKRPTPATTQIGTATRQQLLKDFLSGEQCLRGGTGWWKHELCYGKHVKQYHEDRNSRIEVVLGEWDLQAHKDYLDERTQKRPKPKTERNRLYHYYGGGEFCELSGRKRSTEVKLKCKSEEGQPGMVIYLTEPSTCEYTLVVESSMLCPVIANADDQYGLIDYTDL